MGKRELVALLNLSSWCLVMVEWLFLAVPWGCLRFVIVIFPDHTHLLFCISFLSLPINFYPNIKQPCSSFWSSSLNVYPNAKVIMNMVYYLIDLEWYIIH